VTAAFNPGRAVADLVFLPNEEAPWQGLIAASLNQGGYDIYDLDGEIVMAAAGPRLRSIAAAPSFALRGTSFPLLFGVDSEGALRAQVLIRDPGELIEIGLGEESLSGAVAGVCRYETGIGYVDLAVLGEDDRAEIWRIEDVGEDNLSATLQGALTLPFPARACASAGGDLIVGGPTGGLARVTVDGEVLAETSGYAVGDVFYAELLGRPVAAIPAPEAGQLVVFDAETLDRLSAIAFEGGLNAPGIEEPGGLAETEANFGGSPFAGGIVAVFDEADGRIKLVSREVVTRAVVAPDDL